MEPSMQLHLLEGRQAFGTASFGTVWPEGKVRECVFDVSDQEGHAVPVQSFPAALWPDGSLKWVRHTAHAENLGKQVTVTAGRTPAAMKTPVRCAERADAYFVDTGAMTLEIPKPGTDRLIQNLCVDGQTRIRSLQPVFLLSRVREEENGYEESVREGHSEIREVVMEEEGDVALFVCYRGVYVKEEDLMRFEIRISISGDLLKITHTFFFHGDEQRDRMKGLGLRSVLPLAGPAYNHHVQFMADGVRFHEPVQLLESRIPRTGPGMKREQLTGASVKRDPESDEGRLLAKVEKEMPVWNRYLLSQTGEKTCEIRKRTKPGMCSITALHATHGNGVMAISGEQGGALFGLRDFWQRYPSALQVDCAGTGEASVMIWFWSPEAEAMDFRHYDDRSYISSYEGFEYFGADPEGIAVTSEAVICPVDGFPEEETLCRFEKGVQKPPVYAAAPEEYQARGAFGEWSLPDRTTESGRTLEDYLDSAIDYYLQQRDQRGWYGFFDYGDFRHSYDPDRHTWKYDIGGFAWQQTELVPTYWLWLQFMRTGREDIFSLAEAMSRNTSEVDCYHFGPMKGLGSRHNVRHWGCPCKEPRVSMAGHHRPMYYLTGDLRIGACMQEMADAHLALPHVRWYSEHAPKIRCRTAPDWSSLLSNWMTAYERTGNEHYRELAQHGIEGILAAPMGFASGPVFAFEPETGDMHYDGENTGNLHLSQCFATVEILLEAADAMRLPELKQMCEDYGAIYMMTDEERRKLYGDLVNGKGYSMRYTASAMGAYAGNVRKNPEIMRRAWHELLIASPRRYAEGGFETQAFARKENGERLLEIPWMSTNYISQWCLNTIMVLRFAKEVMPDMAEMETICRESYRLEL